MINRFTLIIYSSLCRDDANDECLKRNASLVSIHSENELLLLRSFVRIISKSKYFWIGLRKNHFEEFSWRDGSRMDFVKWELNQPEHKTGHDCVVVNTNMKWGTERCNNGFSFICGVEKIVPHLNEPQQHKKISVAAIVITVMGLLLLSVIVTAVFIYWYFSKKPINMKNIEVTRIYSQNIRYTNDPHDERHHFINDEYQTGEYSEYSEYSENYTPLYHDTSIEPSIPQYTEILSDTRNEVYMPMNKKIPSKMYSNLD